MLATGFAGPCRMDIGTRQLGWEVQHLPFCSHCDLYVPPRQHGDAGATSSVQSLPQRDPERQRSAWFFLPPFFAWSIVLGI